jgi:RNA polymerase sigma-70 factor, ECF subfamily
VADVATTDNILQEVFIKIHVRIDTLKENTKIQSWIYQITRNAIIDHFRSQKMTEELSEDYPAAEIDHVEKARQEIDVCLLPMIKNLPVPYRQAIMLSEIDGIT